MLTLIRVALIALTSARMTVADDANSILAKSRAAYASLKTYADAGTVVIQDDRTYTRSRFRTFRRLPKDFYYEFWKVSSTGTGGTIPLQGHTVFWMLNGNLDKWDEVGKLHESFPAGVRSQIPPIANSGSSTGGALPIIASLLFPKAAILSDLEEIQTLSLAGTEKIAGHDCYKLTGVAQSRYQSGATFNVRPVTLWIDAQSYLLRQFFTDTPRSFAAGVIHRVTITINPVANPPLNDGNFSYKIPNQ
jgi:outer membrane lipoprotein-sorting protein